MADQGGIFCYRPTDFPRACVKERKVCVHACASSAPHPATLLWRVRRQSDKPHSCTLAWVGLHHKLGMHPPHHYLRSSGVATGWIQGGYKVDIGWIQVGTHRVDTGWTQGGYKVDTWWIQGRTQGGYLERTTAPVSLIDESREEEINIIRVGCVSR